MQIIKILLFTICILTLSSFVSAFSCYQQYANISTTCGGLNTGSYAIVGTWSYPISNMTDGNYITYSFGSAVGAHFYINRSIPKNAIGEIEQYGTGTVANPINYTINISLNSGCINQNLLQLDYYSDASGPEKVYVYCYNYSSLSYSSIFDSGGYVSGGRWIRDTYSIWDMAYLPINTTLINITLQPDNFYNTNNLTTINEFDGLVNFTNNITIQNNVSGGATTEYLSNFTYNIISASGIQVYNFSIKLNNVTNYNFNNSINISSWSASSWYYVYMYIVDNASIYYSTNYKFYLPLHKITWNTINTSNEAYPALTTSTLKGYINTQTELTSPSICYAPYRNNTWINSTPCVSIIANTNYNYASYSPLQTTGIAYDLVTAYANCPTCLSGVAQTIYQKSSNNLTIYNAGLDNCTLYHNLSKNIYFKDLNNNVIQVNYTSSLFYNFNSSQQFNINFSSSAISNYSFCLSHSSVIALGNLSITYSYGPSIVTAYENNLVFTNTPQNITLYLDTATLTNVIATVYDQTNQVTEGVYIEVLKKNDITGLYTSLGSYATNFEGQTQLSLLLNSAEYKFRLYYPFGVLKTETTPTKIYNTALTLRITIGDVVLSDYFLIAGITSSLNYTNSTHTFLFTYNDPSSQISKACLSISSSSNSSNNNQSCLYMTGGTISLTVLNISGNYYVAKGYVTLDDNDYLLKTSYASFPLSDTTSIIGLFGVLFDILLTIAFAFMLRKDIQLVCVLIPMPTLFLSLVNILAVDWRIGVSLQIAGIVLAYIIGRDS